MLRLAVASDSAALKNVAVGDPVVVGERVKRLRLKLKWTQQQLADAAKVTPNTLRGLERATQETRREKVEAIAEALGTTFDALHRADEPINEDHPLLKDLSEEDLQVAQGFHHARTAVRLRVQRLLAGDRDPGLELLERFEKLPAEDQAGLEALLGVSETKLAGPETPSSSSSTSSPAKKADR